MLEKDYYPKVAEWAKTNLGCFHTGIDTGLRLGRIDVVGLRDRGGRLSGRAEVISIEVKRGTQPFATSIGQASGYGIYADRTYLAEYRTKAFSEDERAIAAHLGVGLVRISGEHRMRLTEVVTAPPREPMEGLRLEIVEKLGHSLCTVCASFFQRGTTGNLMSRVVRRDGPKKRVADAVAADKGLVYWLDEVSSRSPNPAGSESATVYHRRYVCPGCVQGLFA